VPSIEAIGFSGLNNFSALHLKGVRAATFGLEPAVPQHVVPAA
jgi:hypothetical protein